MFRDPDDRYGLRTYRRVMLTGSLAIFIVLGVRILRGVTDGTTVYGIAAAALLLLGIFTEPVYHVLVGRRRSP